MFDFAWSEIALIVVVAVIFIGPKDLPVAIKAVTEMIKKARRMAGEFQTHVDEMVREADLHEVRDSINQIRNFDFKGTVERAVDPDGSLRTSFASNPLDPAIPLPGEAAPDATAIEAHSAAELTRPDGVDSVVVPVGAPEEEPEVGPPAFIPPGFSLPDYLSPPRPPAAEPEAPAFVPPAIVAQSPARHF